MVQLADATLLHQLGGREERGREGGEGEGGEGREGGREGGEGGREGREGGRGGREVGRERWRREGEMEGGLHMSVGVTILRCTP